MYLHVYIYMRLVFHIDKEINFINDNNQLSLPRIMKRKFLYSMLLSALLLTSCHAPKNVTYLKEAEAISQAELMQPNSRIDPLLGPGDLLNIRVYASNMASVAQFNKGFTLSPDGQISNMSTGVSNTSKDASTDYYLVNSEGDIDFPVLGLIHVAGKTKEVLAEDIRSMIYPKYVTSAPTVEIRLMNFKVTVLGAVRSPGVVTSSNERLNILEALALAGDLDIKGQRDNILLYRTNMDGTREIHRLNLNERDLLLSPYFNLQQNDFIYVEPNRSAKQNAWQMPQGWNVAISIVGGLSSIAGLVIGIVNLTK